MAARRVAVAASGGRDSTALLHCTVRQAHALGVQVVALHVHHGLVPAADQWLRGVQLQARRWGAEFAAVRLQTQPAAGQSVEAWARRERYQALAALARESGCSAVLLAHHRRDQAETWLLQALRGAGPAGLSAMPVQAMRAGLTWCRPWLQQPREAIEAYVRRHRLRFVDDNSNADGRYARNRLRQQVWPALTQAFADAETALASAAAHAQDARVLATEVAALDLPGLMVDHACAAAGLRLPAWLQLPPARRANALRFWLRQVLGQGAPESLVLRLLQELVPAKGHSPRSGARWPAPQAELRLHQGMLTAHPTRTALDGAAAAHAPSGGPSAAAPQAKTGAGPQQPQVMDLSHPGLWPVPAWGGSFEVVAVNNGGASPALLRQASLRPRTGGERFAAHAAALPRSLKKQYQSAAVPAWQRQGPLVWTADGKLLFVPALGLHAQCLASPGQPQCSLRWVPGLP